MRTRNSNQGLNDDTTGKSPQEHSDDNNHGEDEEGSHTSTSGDNQTSEESGPSSRSSTSDEEEPPADMIAALEHTVPQNEETAELPTQAETTEPATMETPHHVQDTCMPEQSNNTTALAAHQHTPPTPKTNTHTLPDTMEIFLKQLDERLKGIETTINQTVSHQKDTAKQAEAHTRAL